MKPNQIQGWPLNKEIPIKKIHLGAVTTAKPILSHVKITISNSL